MTEAFVRRGGNQTGGCPVVLDSRANLQTAENKFKSTFGGMTTLEADLLLIAASIFAVDRCTPRGQREDFARAIEISIPVVNAARIQPLKPVLEDLLRLLSNDSWRVEFRQQSGVPESDLAWAATDGLTLLFSGGLDSLAASIEFAAQERPLQLVSHTTRNQRVSVVQDELVAALNGIGIKPVHRKFQVSATSRPPGAQLSYDAESSQRTRSFLFLTLGALCARRAGHLEVLYIAENGQLAIHLPLTQARIGAFSTHTAHPEVLARAESFFATVFRLPIRVTNPYVHKTKGEVVATVWNRLRAAIPTSISCWKTARLRDAITHCGICVPCIVRRIAIELHGSDSTAYERDLFSESIRELGADDDGRRNLADFGEFVLRVGSYSDLQMMTEWPDLYSPQIDRSAAIEMYRRAAAEARTVLGRYPNLRPILE